MTIGQYLELFDLRLHFAASIAVSNAASIAASGCRLHPPIFRYIARVYDTHSFP
jgi:hypothetical protein